VQTQLISLNLSNSLPICPKTLHILLTGQIKTDILLRHNVNIVDRTWAYCYYI